MVSCVECLIYASRCFNKTLWILVLKGSMHLIQFSDPPPPAGTDYRGLLVAITGFIFFLWAPKNVKKKGFSEQAKIFSVGAIVKASTRDTQRILV